MPDRPDPATRPLRDAIATALLVVVIFALTLLAVRLATTGGL